MRPTAILLASVVGMAVLAVGTSASGSGGASLQGGESNAARAGAVHRAPAHIAQKKLKKPCKRCKNLVVGQGSGGQATCGPPALVDESVTAASQSLKFVTDQTEKGATENFFYTTAAGDLLFAAIVTDGATITPPAGWQAVPGSDVSDATGRRLQIFYSIPVPLSALAKSDPGDRIGPDSHSFSASAAGAMRGVLLNVSGADQAAPIDAAAAAANGTPSTDVAAPSLAATVAPTQLLFFGATGSKLTWTAPAGMKPLEFSADRERTFGLAHQLLRSASDTGTRSATISSAAESFGALVAVRIPPPTTCPKMRILNRRKGGIVQFKADADGYVPVRLKCQWSRRCTGAIGLLVPVPVASAAVSVPAGKTRTVRLGVCQVSIRCPKSVPRPPRRTPGLFVQVLLEAPNGQLVESTDRRVDGGVLTLR